MFQKQLEFNRANATQFVKYGVTGISTLALYLAAIHVLNALAEWDVVYSSVTAFALAMAFNFLLHRHWTYECERTFSSSLYRYVILTLVGFIVQTAMVTGLPAVFGADEMTAIYLFTAIWPVVSFLVMKIGVF